MRFANSPGHSHKAGAHSETNARSEKAEGSVRSPYSISGVLQYGIEPSGFQLYYIYLSVAFPVSKSRTLPSDIYVCVYCPQVVL